MVNVKKNQICFFLSEYNVPINSLIKALIQKYDFVLEPIPSSFNSCSVAINPALST
jgi:hypothetical protein